MKHWAIDVNTVEEFLDRYCKPERFRGRGEEYAALHVATYEAADKRDGYCYITRHDSVTGREVYFRSNKSLELCDGCELPFKNEQEYADRCTTHEEDCPNFNADDGTWFECDCDLDYHHQCCPECNHV